MRCCTATAYTMLDLQIVPTTSAYNDGKNTAMHTIHRKRNNEISGSNVEQ